MSRKRRKATVTRLDGQDNVTSARDARVPSAMLALGYLIVGLSVVVGCIQSFWPQMLGLQGAPPAVAFALAALAGFRLYALRLEIRRQARQTPDEESAASRSALAPGRVRAGRVRPGR